MRGSSKGPNQGAHLQRAHLVDEGKAEEVGERQCRGAEAQEEEDHGRHAHATELRQVEAVEAHDDACGSAEGAK